MINTGEKIMIILKRRNMTITDLAKITKQSRQNLSRKISHNNFCEKDLKEISIALNCSYHVKFRLNDTSEEI